MERITASIIAFCWIIFLGYWIISALAVKRAIERKSLTSSLAYRIPAVIGGFMIWGTRRPRDWNAVLIPHTETKQILAAAICIAGLLVAIWARRTLAGNWSSNVTFKQNHELIGTGPYRYVRHPIYTGILLMLLGSVIERGHLGACLGFVVMFFALWIKLRQEETLMLQHFPDQYPAYRRDVKALVPWII